MKRNSRYLYLGIFLLFPCLLMAQNVCINEVMSSNSTILADEDGDFSDWIELYNNSDSTINLAGYGLSDDSLNLKKWVFPEINLPPNTHLLLFASDKDRTATISHWETVITQGDNWRYQVGDASIPADWMDLSYDDTGWSEGPSGFGYSDNDDATVINNLLSIFIRRKFEIKDTAAVVDAVLHVDYDDAFVAYLNGQEIARANIGSPGVPVAYNEFADGDHEAVIYTGNSPEKFGNGSIKAFLQNGENILSVQGHNKSETSSDMSLIPFLSLGLNMIPQNAAGSPPLLGLNTFLYHTNFKINSDGENVYLTSQDGQIIDSLWTGSIPGDFSLGRQPDGGSDWFLFDKPTPGDMNDSEGYASKSPMPDFSRTRGFYNDTFYLSLSADPASSYIRYTTDCSKPDRSTGTLYTGPIEISKMTTVRAVAYGDSTTLSDVRTHSFIFPSDVLIQDNSGVPTEQHSRDHVYWTEEFDMNDVTQSEAEVIEALLDLPTIYISAPWDSIFGIAGIHRGQNLEEYGGDPVDPNWIELIECSAEMIYPENYRNGRFKNWQENCGIKIQGGASRWQNGDMDHKQSFTLEFKDRYGAGMLKNEILATAPFNSESVPAEFDKIILRTGFNRDFGSDWDRANYAYTRDQFARDLQIMMSDWGNHGTYVHLYINGKYWGITNPCERMDDNALATYFGGDNEDYFYGKGKGGVLFGSSDRYNYLTNTDWTNRQFSEIEEYLVVDPYIDNVILHSYGNIGDGAQYYFGGRTNPPGPIYYTAWDMEDSFDGGARRSGPPVAVENLESIYSGDKFLAYYQMKHNIDFKMRFADKIYKHCFNDGILTNDRVTAIWDSSCKVISKAMITEIARWGDERGALYDYDHWKEECNDVREDLIGRADKYVAEVKKVGMYPNLDPPVFKSGTEIITTDTYYCPEYFSLDMTFAAPQPGKIYFTTDGTDPRTWDLTGNVSENAIQVAGIDTIIPITEVTVIKARIKDANTWTALTEIKVIPGQTSSIVISEINYDSDAGFDTEDWVELYNNSNTDISMAGWTIKDSIDTNIFVFDAQTILEKDSYLIVCRDTSDFKSFFIDIENCVGDLGFKFGNDGDIVRIFDNNNMLIDSVHYDNEAPWPVGAAGTGRTLELINPDYDNTIPESWQASKLYGTPGGDKNSNPVNVLSVEQELQNVPLSYQLMQNYPNPFNPVTAIGYQLSAVSQVELSIYNLIGQKVATLVSERQNAGSHQVEWDASGFSSGIYFYRLQTDGGFVQTRKLMLIK
jgi:hypothetical protein